MKLKRVKSEKEIVLDGVKVNVEFVDNAIRSVHLTDSKGNVLVFSQENYNFSVSVKAPPEMKKVHVITGEIAGVKIHEIVEAGEYEAKTTFSKLELAGANNLLLKEESIEVN